jgi:proton-translocating NADH-quinone oxidoreductase chain M
MILIPFFILIGISSYRKRRIHASYLFFFFTLFGSFLMLFSLFQIYSFSGSTNIEILFNQQYCFFRENLLWICLFFSLAIKIPMFPFHIWLPEAHVEAPTEGSILLAGVLLKLGSYGFIRFLFPIFPGSSYYFSPLVILLACCSIFYTSFVTIRQLDVKRIIAYSSIAHMNMCVLGLFSFSVISFVGGIHLMLAHGIVSSGLFFLVGMMYNRYHTKIITYYGGIVYTMPLMITFLFFFILSNVSFPMTSNFIGEFLILVGITNTMNYYSLFFVCIVIFICAVYCFWLYNRVAFLLPKYYYFNKGFDLNFIEIVILILLSFFSLWLGIYPVSYTYVLEITSIFYLLELFYL